MMENLMNAKNGDSCSKTYFAHFGNILFHHGGRKWSFAALFKVTDRDN